MPIQRAVSASPLTDPASRFGVPSDRSGRPFWGPHQRLRRTVLRRPTSPVAAAVSAMEEIVAKYEDPPEDGEPAADPWGRKPNG